jgi:K+-sensing histidine kinase KdpD
MLMMDKVASGTVKMNASIEQNKPNSSLSRESLGLLLSCQLAELHGGQISIQGSPESGYRYLLTLPLQTANTETIRNN